jgi:hypothetical protein
MPPKLTVRQSGSAPSRSRAGRHATVDHEFRAGHVAGGVRGEEENPVRDILHLPSPAERYPALATSFGSIGTLRPADIGRFVQIGVSMTPGWTVLTRMPSASAAHSIATALSEHAYAPFFGAISGQTCRSRRPATDDIVMEPPPTRRIAGTAYFTDRIRHRDSLRFAAASRPARCRQPCTRSNASIDDHQFQTSEAPLGDLNHTRLGFFEADVLMEKTRASSSAPGPLLAMQGESRL